MDPVNVYGDVRWMRKTITELATLFPHLRDDLRVFSTSGRGPLAPLVLNLIPVSVHAHGFTYHLTDLDKFFGYTDLSMGNEEVACTWSDVYVLYMALRLFVGQRWDDLLLEVYTAGEIMDWTEIVPESLGVGRAKLGGQAKIFYSAMRACVGYTAPKVEIAVVGSVLVSAGSVYYLLARALTVLGKSGTITLFDPNETEGESCVLYGQQKIRILHVKRKVNYEDLVGFDIILDDAGINVPSDVDVPFFSLKGARMMPRTVIEGQPFYEGSEFRTCRAGPLMPYKHCLGLDTCPNCISVGRLAVSLSPDLFFGPWLVLAFAFLGIVPCAPFPGVRDIIEKGRLYADVCMRKTVDLRAHDVIANPDPSVRWRAALSLLLDGDVECGGSDKITVLSGIKHYLSERRVRPCKVVQHSGDFINFLVDKKFFIHDVISKDLDGLCGVPPQEATVLLANHFPATRMFRSYPQYWISLTPEVDKSFPYVKSHMIKGFYHSWYVHVFDQTIRVGSSKLRTIDKLSQVNNTLFEEVREGPEIKWEGDHYVVFVCENPVFVPCFLSEEGFVPIFSPCAAGDEVKVAVYLTARYTDSFKAPRFIRTTGNISYFCSEEMGTVVPRDDVVKKDLYDFILRGEMFGRREPSMAKQVKKISQTWLSGHADDLINKNPNVVGPIRDFEEMVNGIDASSSDEDDDESDVEDDE